MCGTNDGNATNDSVGPANAEGASDCINSRLGTPPTTQFSFAPPPAHPSAPTHSMVASVTSGVFTVIPWMVPSTEDLFLNASAVSGGRNFA